MSFGWLSGIALGCWLGAMVARNYKNKLEEEREAKGALLMAIDHLAVQLKMMELYVERCSNNDRQLQEESNSPQSDGPSDQPSRCDCDCDICRDGPCCRVGQDQENTDGDSSSDNESILNEPTSTSGNSDNAPSCNESSTSTSTSTTSNSE